jgi:hypothetical protein
MHLDAEEFVCGESPQSLRVVVSLRSVGKDVSSLVLVVSVELVRFQVSKTRTDQSAVAFCMRSRPCTYE